MGTRLRVGRPHPLGGTLVEGGANFSLFSRTTARAALVFFDGASVVILHTPSG